MASKKKKQDENQKAKSDAMMASMFPELAGRSNPGVVPMELAGASDADLEAELAALIGQDNPSPLKQSTPAPPPVVQAVPPPPTLSANNEKAAAKAAYPGLDLDTIQRLLDEDPSRNSDDPSPEDDALLAELDALHGSDSESLPKKIAPSASPSPPRAAPAANSPSPSHSTPSVPAGPSISPLVQELDARVEAYSARVKVFQERGEEMNARRYERQLKTLQQALKDARAGKPVDTSTLPLAIPLAATPSSGIPSKEPSPIHAAGPAAPQAAPMASIASSAAPPAVLPKPKLSNAGAGLTPVEETDATAAQPSQPAPAPAASPVRIRENSTFDAKGGYASRGQKLVLNFVSGATEEARERALEEKLAQLPADRRALLENLGVRSEQFAEAARQAQAASASEAPNANARKYLNTMKQFEGVMKAVFAGQPIDLSQMPPPPPGFPDVPPVPTLTSQATVPKPQTSPKPPVPLPAASTDPDAPPLDPEVASALAGLPSNLDFSQLSKEQKGLLKVGGEGNTPEEALQVRADKLREQLAKAKEANDSGKARRYTRLVQQYEEAIKAVRAGRPCEWGTLFDPPGFEPILQVIARLHAPPAAAAAAAAAMPARVPSATSISRASISPGSSGLAAAGGVPANTKAGAQVNVLLARQLQFKKAALQSKQAGNLAKAKEYLRCAKCMDPMIEAAKSGLAVNMASLPTLSAGGVSYAAGQQAPAEVVDADRVQAIIARGREATFAELNSELKKQTELCKTNLAQFKAIGDVASFKRFEELLRTTEENHKSLALAFKGGDPAPQFHFEARTLKVPKCNMDLSDNDLEITVVRGINLRLPDDLKDPNALKTCVRADLTLKAEEPFSAKSESASGVNPEYNLTKRLGIQRTGQSFARVVKSKAIRVEVLERRGLLFKSEESLGAAHLKLEGLERECELHEALDLMDVKSGRRAVGGRVELRVRIRAPLHAQHSVETRRETVLVIDRWARVRQSPSIPMLAQMQQLPRAALPSSASMNQFAAPSPAAGGRLIAPPGSPHGGSAHARPVAPGGMIRPPGAMAAAASGRGTSPAAMATAAVAGRVMSPGANTSAGQPAILKGQPPKQPPPTIPRARLSPQ